MAALFVGLCVEEYTGANPPRKGIEEGESEEARQRTQGPQLQHGRLQRSARSTPPQTPKCDRVKVILNLDAEPIAVSPPPAHPRTTLDDVRLTPPPETNSTPLPPATVIITKSSAQLRCQGIRQHQRKINILRVAEMQIAPQLGAMTGSDKTVKEETSALCL
ncbi:hypothetical protein FA13DRAFT_1797267 [Coprinellus micaceus]|uniref:Uncharacterized protein n=1 Tax=Coprinellus micaceus TaxID=71717 RepID=A0A4Y7SRA7_COPMI|nr:hypothetical protein FA13DRAFT_1797267 [Coprinellus micaceus]